MTESAMPRWLKTGLTCSAIFLFLGAALHIVLLFLDPKWTAFVGAPPEVVLSLRDGTLLAPVSCIIIASIVTVIAFYVLSLAGQIRRLPLLRLGGAVIGIIFILRGLAILPLLPKLDYQTGFVWFHLIISFMIFLTGVFALRGAKAYKS